MRITELPINNPDIQRWGFDYDGVLDKPIYRTTAYYLQSIARDIFIITKRNINEPIPTLLIPENNIAYTNEQDKSPFVKKFSCQIFLDDTEANLDEIDAKMAHVLTYLVK